MPTAATPRALRQKYFLLGVWALLLGTGHSRVSINRRFDISLSPRSDNQGETIMSNAITTAAAWNNAAKSIKQWNKSHPDDQKKLPSIDRVRARGWMLTINADRHEKSEVDNILGNVPTASVYSEEAGSSTGYRHYQAFAYWEGKITGSRVRALFGDAHCEPAGKPAVACAAYCSKDKTHLSGPYWLGDYESVPGMEPTEAQTERKSIFAEAQQHIAEGWRYEDFLNSSEWMVWGLRHKNAIQDLISAHAYAAYGTHIRDMVSVDYIYGPTESGKSWSVYETYGIPNVFVPNCADASFPFDGYAGQPVVMLEEFRSALKFDFLLKVLDIYPLLLNIKGGRTYACWTKVVITSNIELSEQYPNLTERKDPLLRRFNHGIVFEKPDQDTSFPYASREDAMIGKRNDGGTTGVPGFVPSWKRAASNASSTNIDGGEFTDDDFDALLKN
jgi:hypothetical protein